MSVQAYLDWLGHKVRDRVTGFAGVVDSVSFDLYGCVQASVTPEHDAKDEKRKSGYWLDVKRLEKLSTKPVMEQPVFTKPGAETGPADKAERA